MELKLGGYRIQIAREYQITNTMPKIYNAKGQLLETYFIKNRHSQHAPFGHEGKYFFWDRYNYGLDTHFYGPESMPKPLGKPITKYGMLTESKGIVPRDYEIFRKHKGLEKEFRYIFTYDDEILNTISNAAFYPICAQVWYGRVNGEYVLDAENYRNKTKNVSILSSDKVLCPLHKVRIETARYCRKTGLADTYGTFDGGSYCKVEDTLREYRYSFSFENDISDYFFTEKITNCFAAQTIPIYLGARKISEFFNEDGILFITEKDLDHIEDVLKRCTPEEYERRLPAVLDNYNRVQEYLNMQDYLYEHHLSPTRNESALQRDADSEA